MQGHAAFLSALFDGMPEGSRILIWTLPGKESVWCTSPAAASAAVDELTEGHDVYVGVGLSPRDFGPHGRCKSDDVLGIAALWADIDIAGPGHKKRNLPPDLDAAKQLLADMGLPPSIIVHSGHGLQAWWLLKEPWLFDGAKDRQEAAALSARWTLTLRTHAKRRGWDADAVPDLARVLRVPGTVNRKHEPVPVKVMEWATELRYDPDDFEEYALDAKNAANARAAVGALVLESGAEPPFDKFQALLANEPRFSQSWERKRKDLQDQTASSYDLSLATFAAGAGWSDQEIANGIIAWRRKHGEDLKLRQDYYARTIAKAREGMAKVEAAETLEDMAAATDQEVGPDAKRLAVLQSLSQLFGVGMARIVRYTCDPPTYRLETAAGAIALGDVANLIGQSQLRTKVAAATGRYLPKFKPAEWDKIAQALLDACTDEDLGAEATEAGQAHSWLAEFVRTHPPVEDPSEAATSQVPFRQGGQLYIFGNELRRWLAIVQGEKLGARQMGAMLRAYGCVPEVKGVQIDGGWTTRGVWRLPEDFTTPAPEGAKRDREASLVG